MTGAARPEAAAGARGWLASATLLVLVVTALRLLVLAQDHRDLFVDEAQYWLWGQTIELGYFSKPPLIGWLIRAATDLAGSDSAFWVRAPAPVLHGVTALLLGALGARVGGGRVALWTVVVYLTMPLITVGSLLMTTDTLMFPFLVGGLLAWLAAVERGSAGLGALAGALVGMGFLAKYAAIYHLGCAAVAAALVPAMRPSARTAAAGLAGFLVAIAPNLWWNLENGLITLQHTIDNAEWARDPAERMAFEPAELAEFAGAQVFVFGPVFLAALVWLGATWGRRGPLMRTLLCFSLPILILILGQASVSRAYANWAAGTYLAGTVAVAWLLAERARGWLLAGVAFNAALAVGIALVVTRPGLAPEPVRAAVMDRYTGRVALAEAILAAARKEGLDVIVVDNRDALASLFHTGRDAVLGGEVAVRAAPFEGRPPHHYAMRYPYRGDAPALYVGGAPPPCQAEILGRLAPAGYWEGRPRTLWRIPEGCWEAS